MQNSKLLSSVALFSELYNKSKEDIFEIIGEFIVGVCIHNTKYTFTATELRMLMESDYGFYIPEAVLKTVLNNRLSKRLIRNGNNYFFNSESITNEDKLKYNFDDISSEQQELFNDLIIYIEDKKGLKLSQDEIKNVEENFYAFLLDNGFSETYSNYISAFIISNEGNVKVKQTLLNIKEGLILHEGIKYSPDLNELGAWKNKLTIYLGTEYLFNSQGLNGELFNQIFYDFFNLVREINLKNSSEKIIELKYFAETKNEIDRFFSTAEQIKSGKINLKVSKPAMVNIVNKASDVSDIAIRKALFFQSLNNLGIYEDNYECTIEDLKTYNLEDQEVLKELELLSKENNRNFNEDDTLLLIKTFTKINCLRKGNSNLSFEKCKYLYLSENSLARYLGHNGLIKLNDNDFTFCKEMDFVTTKFWFYLNKGFGGSKIDIPKSFDLINKAKIIISSHLQNSVIEKYDDFTNKVKNKELNEEQIKLINLELKSKIANPEKIAIDVIDSSLEFLENDNYLDKAYEEMLFKDLKLKEQEEKIKAFEEKERKELEEKVRKKQEEKELAEKIALDRRKHQWAIQEFAKEKAENRKNLYYFFKSLIPEAIIVLISVILFRVEAFQEILKNISPNYGLVFWITILLVVVAANYIKSNFIKKELIQAGFKILRRIGYYSSKEFEKQRINHYESIYND
ncbi:hypothetical protein [Myroides injenensis]|uniref:hypothetical protein n=1 Tax=Myroides injenensis TaxID=1183151 RepID=UPI00226E2564|nr:hypothetical protein [Myroides injenensis]